MFNIRHIHEDGVEIFWQAEQVIYVPKSAVDGTKGTLSTPVAVMPGLKGCDHVRIQNCDMKMVQYLYGGIVYVMNDEGKTVARYTLMRPPPVTNDDAAPRPQA